MYSRWLLYVRVERNRLMNKIELLTIETKENTEPHNRIIIANAFPLVSTHESSSSAVDEDIRYVAQKYCTVNMIESENRILAHYYEENIFNNSSYWVIPT